MTNKFIKQYNYAEMSVLNVKSIKVTNGENKDNIPLQVSPKGGGGTGGVQHEKNCCTGLVPAKSTGTQPEPVPAQIPPERVPERVPEWTGTRIPVGS